jgi:hypothetical protein
MSKEISSSVELDWNICVALGFLRNSAFRDSHTKTKSIMIIVRELVGNPTGGYTRKIVWRDGQRCKIIGGFEIECDQPGTASPKVAAAEKPAPLPVDANVRSFQLRYGSVEAQAIRARLSQ